MFPFSIDSKPALVLCFGAFACVFVFILQKSLRKLNDQQTTTSAWRLNNHRSSPFDSISIVLLWAGCSQVPTLPITHNLSSTWNLFAGCTFPSLPVAAFALQFYLCVQNMQWNLSTTFFLYFELADGREKWEPFCHDIQAKNVHYTNDHNEIACAFIHIGVCVCVCTSNIAWNKWQSVENEQIRAGYTLQISISNIRFTVLMSYLAHSLFLSLSLRLSSLSVAIHVCCTVAFGQQDKRPVGETEHQTAQHTPCVGNRMYVSVSLCVCVVWHKGTILR